MGPGIPLRQAIRGPAGPALARDRRNAAACAAGYWPDAFGGRGRGSPVLAGPDVRLINQNAK